MKGHKNMCRDLSTISCLKMGNYRPLYHTYNPGNLSNKHTRERICGLSIIRYTFTQVQCLQYVRIIISKTMELHGKALHSFEKCVLLLILQYKDMIIIFENVPFPPSFLHFRLFNTVVSKHVNVQNKS